MKKINEGNNEKAKNSKSGLPSKLTFFSLILFGTKSDNHKSKQIFDKNSTIQCVGKRFEEYAF